MATRLFRSDSDRVLGGVCGGLAHYFSIDSTLVRLIFVVSVLSGISPLFYIVLWLIIPNESTVRTPPALPTQQQDPTGEWQYDPYTGEPLRREQQV